MKPNADAIRCKNGVTLIVQASEFHYCTPRDDEGPYRAVEVGFIEKPNGDEWVRVTPPRSWKPYADGKAFPNNVYGFVPMKMVLRFIKRQGGIESGALPIYELLADA